MEIKKICAQCGKEFTADRKNRKFCSPECYQKHQCKEKREAWAKKHAEQLAEKNKIETIKDCKHKDCIYRPTRAGSALQTCDYCLITKMPRGCKISECDKYKPKGGRK